MLDAAWPHRKGVTHFVQGWVRTSTCTSSYKAMISGCQNSTHSTFEVLAHLQHVSLMLGSVRLSMRELMLQMLHLADSFLPLVISF